MNIAKGARLIAAVPVYAGNDWPREWLVAADCGPDEYQRYVVTAMASLDETWWFNGAYYMTEKEAMAAFYLRSNIHALDVEHLRAVISKP